MLDKFIQELNYIEKLVTAQKTYIRSTKTKNEVKRLYEKHWLPYSEDFKTKFGTKNHKIIEDALSKSHQMARKDYFEKRQSLNLFRKVEDVLNNIRLESIRKYGYIIELDKKQIVVKSLQGNGFTGTLRYLRDSENEYTKSNWKPSCFNSRLTIEEFLREFREKKTGKRVPTGTLGEHINALEKYLSFSLGEKLLFKGFYGFLSNKGGHATTDNPSQEDAKLSIYLMYMGIEYLLERYGDNL